MKAILVLLAVYVFVAWNDAHAEYYKLMPNVAVEANRRGDELFAEMVTNLPESAIVNAPQSAAVRIYGSCSRRQYTKQGFAFFSEKWRGGYIVSNYPPDNLILKVLPNTPIAALFDRECVK